MLVPITVVKQYKKVGGNLAPAIILNDVQNLRVTKSFKDNKDTFSFTVPNHRERIGKEWIYTSASDFGLEDFIEIFAYYKKDYTGDLNDHCIFRGYVIDSEYSSSQKKTIFKIQGNNTTDGMMNIMVIALYGGERSANAGYMVYDLAYKANTNAGSLKRQLKIGVAEIGVDDNGDFVRTGGGYIWPVNSQGQSFPVVPYVKNHASLFTHLKNLSITEYTNDPRGTFLYYVDGEDNLHFEPKPKFNNLTFKEYVDSPSTVTKKVTSDGMINVVMYNAGPDPNGNGTFSTYRNSESIAKYGAKYKYISDDKISKNIFSIENTPLTETDQNGENIISDETFYPLVFPWYARQSGSIGTDEGQSYTVGDTLATKKQYKDYIRVLLRSQGKAKAEDISTVLGNPRDTVKWEPQIGSDAYKVGDFLEVKFDSIDFTKKLRIDQITHSFDGEWLTTLNFTEDPVIKL